MYKSLIILCLCMTINLFGEECSHSMENFRVEAYRGEEISAHAQEIVGLVVKIYAHYPYFTTIDEGMYTECLKFFAQSNHVIISVAFDGDKEIGLAAGIPMKEMPDFYKNPFFNSPWKIDNLFFFGEFGLDPDYRDCGIEQQLYSSIEDFAKKADDFQTICRWEFDPAPDFVDPSYSPNSDFWENLGFVKNQELNFKMNWKNTGDDVESDRRVVFAIKSLE